MVKKMVVLRASWYFKYGIYLKKNVTHSAVYNTWVHGVYERGDIKFLFSECFNINKHSTCAMYTSL